MMIEPALALGAGDLVYYLRASIRENCVANPEHVEIVRAGTDAIREWRHSHPGVRMDLSEADLTDANLIGADLTRAELNWATLRGSNLSGANLTGSDLIGADLLGVNLTSADLIRANCSQIKLSMAQLIEADLTDADLSDADIEGAVLCGTKLNGTKLTWAHMSGAVLQSILSNNTDFGYSVWSYTFLVDSDVSGALNLKNAQHTGPSFIGIDTIVKSKGKIPDAFLRGAGVPQQFIDYIPSLLGSMQPIQHYSCFISYSSQDDAFARRLHSRMRDENLRTWFAPEDMKGGRKSYDQIDQAIRFHDKLLLVLSKESMASDWVITEIRKARKREEREDRQMLFPIGLVDFGIIKAWECFDTDTGRDLAREVRAYHIPDFSDWKNQDSFEKGFERLLADLSLDLDGARRDQG